MKAFPSAHNGRAQATASAVALSFSLSLSIYLSVYTYPQRGNNNDRVAITLEYLTASLCC